MKALLYCTKAKPFIHEDRNPNSKTFGSFLLSDKPDPFEKGKDGQDLNGLVAAECEINESFWIKPLHLTGDDSYYSYPLRFEDFLKRSCLSDVELNTYGKGKDLYAYHLGNVKAIEEPFPVTQLYSDGACTKSLKRAPQSWCYAYRKIFLNCEDEEGYQDLVTNADSEEEMREIEKVNIGFCKYLIFSIRSPYVALELNIDPVTGKPFKDLEIRNRKIMNEGIEYK